MQSAQLKVVINNGGTNGINSFNTDGNVNKTYYTLNGQRTLNPQKGVYILNGKKMVIK